MSDVPTPEEAWPVLSDEEWEQKVADFLATTYQPDPQTLQELASLPPEERYIQLTLMHGFVSSRDANKKNEDESVQ